MVTLQVAHWGEQASQFQDPLLAIVMPGGHVLEQVIL
jgi:hypothetical protein